MRRCAAISGSISARVFLRFLAETFIEAFVDISEERFTIGFLRFLAETFIEAAL